MGKSLNDKQSSRIFIEQLNNKSITTSTNSDAPMLNNRHHKS